MRRRIWAHSFQYDDSTLFRANLAEKFPKLIHPFSRNQNAASLERSLVLEDISLDFNPAYVFAEG